MASILFVTWDGGGNVPPMLVLAAAARRDGHGVRVMGHPSQAAAVESTGLRFEAYTTARPWSPIERRSGLRADLAYAAVFADRGLGRDVVASVRRQPVDRIVVDGLLIGALSELDRASYRYTILVHTFRALMHRALVSGPLGTVLRLRGLRAGRLYGRAALELVATDAGLDPGSDEHPSSIFYTGPLLSSPVAHTMREAEPARVLVSLSTTYVQGQTELLQRIIDALAPLPVVTVVTTGPAVDASDLRASPRTELHAFVPHAEVMPTASVVIGHGGHATTMLALAHGIPLLIIPTNPSFDQPFIGRVIAENGLGLTLSKKATEEQIREAVSALEGDSGYRQRAGEVGRRIRAQANGVSDAVRLLVAERPETSPPDGSARGSRS